MQSPEVQRQLNTMMDDPAVLDQIIAASPELRAMGPQARQISQSFSISLPYEPYSLSFVHSAIAHV